MPPRTRHIVDTTSIITLDDMACSTCGLLLYTHTSQNGSDHYEHTQPWRTHDHPPDPVKAHTIRHRLAQICDFCDNASPTVLYKAPPFVEGISGGRHDTVLKYSEDWRACPACIRYIKNRDIHALADLIEQSPRNQQRLATSTANLAEDRRHNIALFTFVVPRLRYHAPITPWKPPKPLHLGQTRKIHEQLTRYVRSSTFADDFVLSGKDADLPYPRHLTTSADRTLTTTLAIRFGIYLANALDNAALYYVSHHFTHLAARRARTLSHRDVTLPELPRTTPASTTTALNGFILWQDPVYQIPDTAIAINAASWSEIPTGLWISYYARSEDLWIDPLERGPLALVTSISIPWAPSRDDTPAAPAAEINPLVATILATWQLMRSPGIADITPKPPDRKLLKRAARTGQKPPPDIHVIDLRAQPSKNRNPADASTPRNYRWRWPVGFDTAGFERTYWVGPGRKTRTTHWIQPYIAGPEDAPLKPDTTPVTRLK